MKHTIAPSNEKDLRKIVESSKNTAFVALESNPHKDTLRYMASGLTPVIARIMTRQHNAIGIDITYLRHKEKKEKAIALARIKQNIFLARKAGTALALPASYPEGHYLLLSLGASTNQAKEARTQSF